MKLLVACLLAAAFALPAAGQTMYKSTLPNGKVVYGDKPAPGAAKVEEVIPDTSKQGLGAPLTTGEKNAARKLERDQAARDKAEERLRTAQRRLNEAEAARAAGVEPLEGERQGNVGGSSRFTESYATRQRRLEQNVERARRELEQAQRAAR